MRRAKKTSCGGHRRRGVVLLNGQGPSVLGYSTGLRQGVGRLAAPALGLIARRRRLDPESGCKEKGRGGPFATWPACFT